MANYNHEKEMKSLQNIVARLSGEIEYKNHMLMEMDHKNSTMIEALKEKERLLTERSAVISLLAEGNMERDRLLDEKTSVITALTEERDWLLHEISTATNMWQDKEFESISALMAQNAEKDRLLEEKSAAINELMADKDRWFEAYLKELAKTENLKLEFEKLQQESESRMEELQMLMKEHNDMAYKQETVITEIRKVECSWEHPTGEPDLQAAEEFEGPQVLAEVEVRYSMEGLVKPEEIQNLEELRAQVNTLTEQLEEKEGVVQNLEMDNRTLMIKERTSNQELQAARKAASEGLQAMQGPRVLIGIKRMGEVDSKPFRDACSKRFRSGDWDEKFGNYEEKALELCSSWQREISNPGWQPLKKEVVNGKLIEVIDENDEKLKELREEWGEEAYNAVAEALLGVNEYNASGRYPVSELWNFKENRRAPLGEVFQYIIKQWQAHKKKKLRC